MAVGKSSGNHREALKDLGAAFPHDDGLHAENIIARPADEGQLIYPNVFS